MALEETTGAEAERRPPRARPARTAEPDRADPAVPPNQARHRSPGGAIGDRPAAGGRAAPSASPPSSGDGAGWTPPPPPARLVRREGAAAPVARRTPPGRRPNLPVPPVSPGALVPGHAGERRPLIARPPRPGQAEGPRYPERVVVAPDDDTRGRTVIDERRAEARARRRQDLFGPDRPAGVEIVETFTGPRLASHVGSLRRIRSSFLLVVVAGLLALVFAGVMAGIVGGLAVAISHASGNG